MHNRRRDCLDALVFVVAALQVVPSTVALELAARAAGVNVQTLGRVLKEQLSRSTRCPLVTRLPLHVLRMGLTSCSSARRVLILTEAGQEYLRRCGLQVVRPKGAVQYRHAFAAALFVVQHVARGAQVSVLGRIRSTTYRHGDLHLAVLPAGIAESDRDWDREIWTVKLAGGDLDLPVLIDGRSPWAPRISRVYLGRLDFARQPYAVFHGWKSGGISVTFRNWAGAPPLRELAGFRVLTNYFSVADWSRHVAETVRRSGFGWDQFAEALAALAAFARLPFVPFRGDPRKLRESSYSYRRSVEDCIQREILSVNPSRSGTSAVGGAAARGHTGGATHDGHGHPPRGRAMAIASPPSGGESTAGVSPASPLSSGSAETPIPPAPRARALPSASPPVVRSYPSET